MSTTSKRENTKNSIVNESFSFFDPRPLQTTKREMKKKKTKTGKPAEAVGNCLPTACGVVFVAANSIDSEYWIAECTCFILLASNYS